MSTQTNLRTSRHQTIHLDTVLDNSYTHTGTKQQKEHIRYDKSKNLWVVRLCGNGRYIKVGEFLSVKEAIKQYLRACKMYGVIIQKECLNYA